MTWATGHLQVPSKGLQGSAKDPCSGRRKIRGLDSTWELCLDPRTRAGDDLPAYGRTGNPQWVTLAEVIGANMPLGKTVRVEAGSLLNECRRQMIGRTPVLAVCWSAVWTSDRKLSDFPLLG